MIFEVNRDIIIGVDHICTKYDIGKATLQQRVISIAILLDKAIALEKAQKDGEPAPEHLNKAEAQ